MSKETIVRNLVADLADRVWLNPPNNPTLPYVYVQVDGEYDHVIGEANYFDAVAQFDVMGRDFNEVLSIMETIRIRLDGHSDENILYSMVTEEITLNRPPANAEESWLFRKALRVDLKMIP